MPKKSKLDKEEQEILNSFERGEWESTNPTTAELHKFQKIARASLAKDKRINIRLPARVLEGIQLRAAQEGLPYQTLISSILYKFAAGRLIDSAYNDSVERTSKRDRSR
jgi:predicted DNA binding CopG/RHH family protein